MATASEVREIAWPPAARPSFGTTEAAVATRDGVDGDGGRAAQARAASGGHDQGERGGLSSHQPEAHDGGAVPARRALMAARVTAPPLSARRSADRRRTRATSNTPRPTGAAFQSHRRLPSVVSCLLSPAMPARLRRRPNPSPARALGSCAGYGGRYARATVGGPPRRRPDRGPRRAACSRSRPRGWCRCLPG